ncbi:MAG: pantoate--beta-alanine ligase [candidate division Zixibacteria bacterium]|nr:pantoate--beta-alanine ligase [candidate division Zixibacteria bacterium]
MEIIRDIKKMQRRARALAAAGKKIGLVPTMGFLHEGHISLIRRAKKLSDIVITTIFVNPTQFAPNEDFGRYPRDEKGDLAKIRGAGGDIVFIPNAENIYPEDFQTYVTAEEITKSLDGAVRPGHFRGVTTIVAKLFNITRPDVALFGMKDYQQAIVLKQMVRDLNFPIKMIIAPTKREKDGLAMSSRNKYFSPEQRKEVVCLYQALEAARKMIKVKGARNPELVRNEMKRIIKSFCPTAQIDYIAFTDFETLKPVMKIDADCVCSLAVRLYGVRLIDNMRLL